MHGREIPVRARVQSISGLSGHADAGELLRWYRSGPSAPAAIFVTHGESGPAEALAKALRGEGAPDVRVPAHESEFDLATLA
jgi:metallo-beta-lactamase family protein